MIDHEDPPQPEASIPPPPPRAPADLHAEQPTQDLRGVTIVATIVGAALVGFRFLGGVLGEETMAYTIGASFGTLAVPVILGALIGWGNQRRARIAFSLFAGLVLLSTMARAGASLDDSPDPIEEAQRSISELEPAATLEEDANNRRAVVDDVLDDLDDREFSAEAGHDERAELLLKFLGTRYLNTDEGRCLVDATAGFTDTQLAELETFDEVPSGLTLTAFSNAARSCGTLKLAVESFRDGAVDSGATPEFIDEACAQGRLEEDPGATLFALTGNRAAVVVPEFVDPSSTFLVYVAPLGDCLQFGALMATDFPDGLSEPSFTCMNSWGRDESRVLRLFAGALGDVELFGGLESCLTEEEFSTLLAEW